MFPWFIHILMQNILVRSMCIYVCVIVILMRIIQPLHFTITHVDKPFMVLEMCLHGTLDDFLKQNSSQTQERRMLQSPYYIYMNSHNQTVTPQQMTGFAAQVAGGLAYIHKQKVKGKNGHLFISGSKI